MAASVAAPGPYPTESAGYAYARQKSGDAMVEAQEKAAEAGSRDGSLAVIESHHAHRARDRFPFRDISRYKAPASPGRFDSYP